MKYTHTLDTAANLEFAKTITEIHFCSILPVNLLAILAKSYVIEKFTYFISGRFYCVHFFLQERCNSRFSIFLIIYRKGLNELF